MVVDVATGNQRRALIHHHSTQAEKRFLAVLEGKPLRYAPHTLCIGRST
jgi:hypothetical protein